MTKEERLEYLKNWKKNTQNPVETPEDVIDEGYSDEDMSEDFGYSQSYIDDINSYFKVGY